MKVALSVFLILANSVAAQTPTASKLETAPIDSLSLLQAESLANEAEVGRYFGAGFLGGVGVGAMGIQGWSFDADLVPRIISGAGAALIIYSASETVQPLRALPPNVAAALEGKDSVYRSAFIRAYADRLGFRQRTKLTLGALLGAFLGLAIVATGMPST